MGLVVGPWGDASKDMHHLIKILGRVGDKYLGAGGVIVGKIHRIISCAFVRAQALCLPSCFPQLFPHARGAAQRQSAQVVRHGEYQAVWNVHFKGRGLS